MGRWQKAKAVAVAGLALAGCSPVGKPDVATPSVCDETNYTVDYRNDHWYVTSDNCGSFTFYSPSEDSHSVTYRDGAWHVEPYED